MWTVLLLAFCAVECQGGFRPPHLPTDKSASQAKFSSNTTKTNDSNKFSSKVDKPSGGIRIPPNTGIPSEGKGLPSKGSDDEPPHVEKDDFYDGKEFEKTGSRPQIKSKNFIKKSKGVIRTWLKCGGDNPEQQSRNFTEGPSPVTEDIVHSIVNGDRAHRKQQPYMVTIQLNFGGAWYHVCGGALITPKHVLSAAHCLRWWGFDDKSSLYDYRVGLNWYDLTLGTENPNSQTYGVKRAKRNARYRYRGVEFPSTIQPNDIAVLTLRGEVDIGQYVSTVELADTDEEFTEERCVLVGWGDTGEGYPSILQRTELTVMDQTLCRQFWRIGNSRIYSQELCTWDWPFGLSTGCKGDSGGPLVCRGKLAGIVSWGLTYCNGCFPGINTRISAFRDWIEETIGDSLDEE